MASGSPRMKMLRILTRIALAVFVAWGIVALFHTWAREPGQRPFLFWLVLPYPVLIALTVFIVAACARKRRPDETGFSWFAVGVGAAASIGLASAVSIGLFSIISWAYFGHVSLTSDGPTDPMYVAISIALFIACYMWGGAISAALSPQRPLAHALAAGGVLLLWSCAMTCLAQPLVISQLLVTLALPIPLAAWGARLQRSGGRTGAGLHTQTDIPDSASN